MELKTGTVLQNGKYPYVIERVLGIGGFGITYKGYAEINTNGSTTKQYFAIKEHFIKEWCEREGDTGKIIPSNPLRERVEDGKRDFLAEARRLSQITHPNIVKVFEVFEENDTAYYVMEYVEGQNLNDFVARNGALPSDYMLKLFMPLCNAVESLHNNNMTHLDIKPGNIMLKEQNGQISPVLIDFGLSKHYDEQGNATSTIRVQGCSDGYAPMEQYVGVDTFSPQSDIYALAASMLYCLIAKCPPRASEINDSVINSLFLPETPFNVRNAIIHAMQASKNSRTKNVNQLVYELQNSANNQSMAFNTPISQPQYQTQIQPQPQYQAQPQIQPQYASQPINKNEGNNKIIIWITLAVIVVLIGCIIFLLANNSSNDEPAKQQETTTEVTTDNADNQAAAAEEARKKEEQQKREEEARIKAQEAQEAAAEAKRQKQELANNRRMYGNCTLKGTISGKSFTITLNNGFNGYSCYNPKYGTMDIYGESYGNQLNLSEYNNGNYVGSYEGTFDGNTYKGTYYRDKDGKAMKFSMRAQ